jgi:hypothetical protein
LRKHIAWAAAALALVAAAVAGAETTFTDPTGDSTTAPDLTSVAVANDAAGNITFRVNVANQPTLAADAEVVLLLDTDRNVATGEDGDDFIVYFSGANSSFGLLRWDGSDYVLAPATTFRVSYTGGVFTVTGNRSELGNTTGFWFYLFGLQFDTSDNVVASDDAPDGTLVWDYSLTALTPALSLTAGAPTGRPVRPQAGKTFVVSVPVRRSDTRAQLTAGGSVTCKATVSGKSVKATGRYGSGKPQCVLRIPRATKGKMVRGSLTVAFQGKKVTKAFSFRVT